jgi:hypothetical protein
MAVEYPYSEFSIRLAIREPRRRSCGYEEDAVSEEDDPLVREFDFSKARPNRFWLGVVDTQCVRLNEKDLAELFPDNESVNAALRAIADAANRANAPR